MPAPDPPASDLIAARARLADARAELAHLREQAADAAERAATRLAAATREINRLKQALAEATAPPAFLPDPEPPTPEPLPPVADLAPAPIPLPPVRNWRRTAALPAWRLIRPIARPLLWRTRTFMNADAVRDIAALREAHNSLVAALDHPVPQAVASPPPPPPPPIPSPGLAMGDTAAERWLLTSLLLAPGHP